MEHVKGTLDRGPPKPAPTGRASISRNLPPTRRGLGWWQCAANRGEGGLGRNQHPKRLVLDGHRAQVLPNRARGTQPGRKGVGG